MSSDRTALRLTRLLAMLPWVMAHEGVTIHEVRERFGYRADADVMKDLELVFLCGLPGYGPGELMDAYVLGDEVVVEDADYFSRPLRLNAAEALVLLAAGSAVMASSAAPPALASALRKLESVVAPGDAVTVDLGAEPEYVDTLRRAARDGVVVRIEYTSIGTGETTIRSIEPWTVFSSLGNWYVRAQCRLAEGERLFRVDRVRDLVATDEAFETPTDADVPEHLYTPSADDVHATIRLGPRASWVTEYFRVEVVETTEEGTVIDFASSSLDVIARLLIRLGDDARVLDGDGVHEAVDDLRSRILTRYE